MRILASNELKAGLTGIDLLEIVTKFTHDDPKLSLRALELIASSTEAIKEDPRD